MAVTKHVGYDGNVTYYMTEDEAMEYPKFLNGDKVVCVDTTKVYVFDEENDSLNLLFTFNPELAGDSNAEQ